MHVITNDGSRRTERTPEQSFGDALRAARRQNRISQGSVADQMQMRGFDTFDQSKVSGIERGSRPIRVNEAVALAQIVGADLVDMFMTGITGEISDSQSAVMAERLAYARMISTHASLLEVKAQQERIEESVLEAADEYATAEAEWHRTQQRVQEINAGEADQ